MSKDLNIKNTSLEAYKKMIGIRMAGQELVNLYINKKIFSMVHFYVGQEAVAVGVSNDLGPEDKSLGNHRSHGHYLAKGGDLNKLVAELLGRKTGAAKGKGGSMHMIDRSVNFVGSTPLLGSVVPIATGVAFEKKYNKKEGIVVAFLGDGASEEGVVYESYNLAALHKLPLLVVVENNSLSIQSKLSDRRSEGYSLEKISTGLGMKYMRADGNDYNDVHDKAAALIDGIRKGSGPCVLECLVYRHMAHSTPLSDEAFRTEDTFEKRLEKDSLKKLRGELLAAGIPEGELAKIDEEAKQNILNAIDLGFKADYPEKEELFTDVYAK